MIFDFNYEEESSEDPSMDEDLKNLPTYCVWKKEVDVPKVVEKNILVSDIGVSKHPYIKFVICNVGLFINIEPVIFMEGYINMQQIPKHVIKTCLLIPISRIQLVDCDNGDKYDCELHTELGSGDEGSKDEFEAKEASKKDTQYVVIDPDKGKVLGSDKGNMVGSGDEGSKHEVEAKEPAKEDTECTSTEPDKGKKTQFPAFVIKKYFTEPHSSIIIYDSGMCKSHPCKLKTHKDPDKMEMYICKGWYEFAEARCLGKGDILKFTIEYPPASYLLVSVDKN
ncbi:hypothetical protein RYX36_009412 [Vicia faba]